MSSLTDRLSALSEGLRLRICRLLDRQELSVGELAKVVQQPQSTVSRHLKVLADEGWLVSRRRGTMNQYAMKADDLPLPAKKLWALAREQTDNWPALRQDELRLQRRLEQHPPDAKSFFAGAAGEWEKLRRQLYGERFLLSVLAALTPSEYTIADQACHKSGRAASASRSSVSNSFGSKVPRA